MNFNSQQRSEAIALLTRLLAKERAAYTQEKHEHYLEELEHRHYYQHTVYHMERWAFTAIVLLCRSLHQAEQHIKSIEDFVRYHKGQKRDDRCWLDDAKLYELVLGEVGWKPELMPKGEFLENCAHYYDCQAKGLPYQGQDSGAPAAPPEPKRCAVPWFCDQAPGESGLCQYHKCNEEGCLGVRYRTFGVCINHCDEVTKERHEAEEKRRRESP